MSAPATLVGTEPQSENLGGFLREFRGTAGELAGRLEEMLCRIRGSQPNEVSAPGGENETSFVREGQEVRGNLHRVRAAIDELEKYV